MLPTPITGLQPQQMIWVGGPMCSLWALNGLSTVIRGAACLQALLGALGAAERLLKQLLGARRLAPGLDEKLGQGFQLPGSQRLQRGPVHVRQHQQAALVPPHPLQACCHLKIWAGETCLPYSLAFLTAQHCALGASAAHAKHLGAAARQCPGGPHRDQPWHC